MKVIDYHEAIFASELTSNAKLTALAISKYYNWKENKMCWPSNKTLAKATSLSIRSIVRAKNELVNAGYLVSHRRFNDSNVYRTITPSQIGNYLGTESSTNNELNNEVNNEIKDKDSNESFVMINNFIPKDVSDYPSLAEVKAIAAEDYWAVFESR
jgi:DNA-binding transcriptional MocR family regulator